MSKYHIEVSVKDRLPKEMGLYHTLSFHPEFPEVLVRSITFFSTTLKMFKGSVEYWLEEIPMKERYWIVWVEYKVKSAINDTGGKINLGIITKQGDNLNRHKIQEEVKRVVKDKDNEEIYNLFIANFKEFSSKEEYDDFFIKKEMPKFPEDRVEKGTPTEGL